MKPNSTMDKSISSLENSLCNFLRATVSLYEAMIKKGKKSTQSVCYWNQDDEYMLGILKLIVDYQQLLLKRQQVYFQIFGLDYKDLNSGNDPECLPILQETVLKLEAHFFYKMNSVKVKVILNQMLHHYQEMGFQIGEYTESPHSPSPPWLSGKKVRKVKKGKGKP